MCIIQNFRLNLKTNCCKDIGHTKKQVFILSYWNKSSANWTTNEKWRIHEAICFSFISIILYKQSVLTSSCRKTVSRKLYQYYFKICILYFVFTWRNNDKSIFWLKNISCVEFFFFFTFYTLFASTNRTNYYWESSSKIIEKRNPLKSTIPILTIPRQFIFLKSTAIAIVISNKTVIWKKIDHSYGQQKRSNQFSLMQ